MQTYLFILAALLYLACAFLPSTQRKTIAVLVAVAWLLHGGALWADVIGPAELRVGFSMMLSATLWVSVAAYWLEDRNYTLDGLRVLVLPIAASAVILPALYPGNMVHLDGKSPVFLWHIVISILAYSTLTIAAFHAVLMVLQESRLHGKSYSRPHIHVSSSNPHMQVNWFAATLDRLPALMTMEKLLFRLIAFGFILLTLTVLSGVVFSEELFGKAFKWDHKTIFTMLSWALFGLLLAGRKWQGWRGRTALSFTLIGFAILLLGYVGSRFVLEVVLHRTIVG
ncbi:MAG: cytochrome c biogenesis protein CcsA [Glaciimonas sp.]|nr:cytochrome c biogenesis protein CcsA [Glaciimonas sp.]